MVSVNLKALFGKLNDTMRSAVEGAAGLCMIKNHYQVEIEHLLAKLLDNPTGDLGRIAKYYGMNISRLESDVMASLDRLKSGNNRSPVISPTLVDTLVAAWLLASLDYDTSRIRSGFIILASVRDDRFRSLLHGSSSEFQKISADELGRRFLEIVSGSAESERPASVPRVFISYRREDEFYADSLYDRIVANVPEARVFRDSDALQPGTVFPEKIQEEVRYCDILLALIGRKWITATDLNGLRKLDKQDDWVRLEISLALRHGKVVVPCLLANAKMPRPEQLPPELTGLCDRHAVAITQANFRRDTEELIEMMKKWREHNVSAP